ncbi:hypothetical protein GCM10011591_44440 [Nocardia camponoti]|uniref:Uncharacterized protein n=1 Tax=Nocardia camponoti TaxID=1616106 RepID=A0A917QT75_9NOCA|nr:hypothetical protein GCM10011591_44440 [Nocardia camponoti]
MQMLMLTGPTGMLVQMVAEPTIGVADGVAAAAVPAPRAVTAKAAATTASGRAKRDINTVLEVVRLVRAPGSG